MTRKDKFLYSYFLVSLLTSSAYSQDCEYLYYSKYVDNESGTLSIEDKRDTSVEEKASWHEGFCFWRKSSEFGKFFIGEFSKVSSDECDSSHSLKLKFSQKFLGRNNVSIYLSKDSARFIIDVNGIQVTRDIPDLTPNPRKDIKNSSWRYVYNVLSHEVRHKGTYDTRKNWSLTQFRDDLKSVIDGMGYDEWLGEWLFGKKYRKTNGGFFGDLTDEDLIPNEDELPPIYPVPTQPHPCPKSSVSPLERERQGGAEALTTGGKSESREQSQQVASAAPSELRVEDGSNNNTLQSVTTPNFISLPNSEKASKLDKGKEKSDECEEGDETPAPEASSSASNTSSETSASATHTSSTTFSGTSAPAAPPVLVSSSSGTMQPQVVQDKGENGQSQSSQSAHAGQAPVPAAPPAPVTQSSLSISADQSAQTDSAGGTPASVASSGGDVPVQEDNDSAENGPSQRDTSQTHANNPPKNVSWGIVKGASVVTGIIGGCVSIYGTFVKWVLPKLQGIFSKTTNQVGHDVQDINQDGVLSASESINHLNNNSKKKSDGDIVEA